MPQKGTMWSTSLTLTTLPLALQMTQSGCARLCALLTLSHCVS